MLPHYLVKLEMLVVSRTRHWSIVPCVQVCCPVGIGNCHRIFPWCMATASPSAVLHDNSRRSLSLQVAQFHIPTGQHTCVQSTWHNRTFTPRDARLPFSRPVAPKQPRYVPLWLWDLGCNATAGLRETHKWRRRPVLATVECVAQAHSIGQNVIDKAIDQWRAWLTACVRAKGGHFEKLM